jgi:outer membrane protein OmpA-like peptidoglycan-associated protein
MSFGTHWGIRTDCCNVELELNEDGERLTHPQDIEEAESVVFILSCAVENREPRVTKTVLQIYAQFNPHRFPPGTDLQSLETRDIDPIRSDLIEFIEKCVDRCQLVPYFTEPFLCQPKWEDEPAQKVQPTAVAPVVETAYDIGVHLTDQDKKNVGQFRVRITPPDGSEPIESKTNSAGEFWVRNLAVPGTAKIELLDSCDAGAAEAPEWPEEKEYKVTVTDEAGNAVPYVWVKFTEGKRYNLIRANKDGLATYKTTSEDVTASFHDVSELTKALKPIWAESSSTNRADWVKPEDGKVTVVSPRAGVLQQYLPATAASTSTAEAPADKAVATKEAFAQFEAVALTAGKEHQISVQPHVSLVRLVGVNFDTDKCFLLPTALPTLRRIKELFDEHRRDSLMIVGHADTKGGIAHNQDISLDRAAAVWSFLRDDVEGWLSWYDSSVSASCRWGTGEDRQMLRGLVARKQGLLKPETKDYQVWHNALADDKKARNWLPLEEDGKLGDLTRAQIIGDYMNLDGTTLPEDCEVWLHGCGESFPLPEPKQGNAWERFSELRNRRVEFLFFDETTDVAPIPAVNKSTAASTEYPTWLAKAEIEDLTTEAGLKEVTFVEMHDALFRTNSAVILPEGEDPTTKQGGGRALTTVGLFATVLRYNEEHLSSVDASGNTVYKKLFIAGHTDTKGSDQFNQPLSEERAKVALAMLSGDRDNFAKLCQKRHDGVDLTQIFHWVSDSPDFGFGCKPTLNDQPPSTTTVTHFKQSYDAAFDAKFKGMPGAKKFGTANGTQDEALWGAIFDCYEYGLCCELGDMETSTEGKDELERLRGALTWVDDNHKTMGFGERFPVDNATKNEFRSQSNRRVEIMMFDEGEEPDLNEASTNPEVMETYLPGLYGKRAVPPYAQGSVFFAIRVHDAHSIPMGAVPYRLSFSGTTLKLGTTVDGWVRHTLEPTMCFEYLDLEWGVLDSGNYPFRRAIAVQCSIGDERQQATARLHNLGYAAAGDKYELAVMAFQSDYAIGEEGLLNGALRQKTQDALWSIYRNDYDASDGAGKH